jgi:septal ring factor EnvC (AmiA/AmiB activator)
MTSQLTGLACFERSEFMSISPSPIPAPGNEPRMEPPTPPPTSGSPSASKLPLLIVAIVMVLGLGGLFYYTKTLNERMDQMQKSLEASLTNHSQSLEQITRRLDLTDTRHSELQGQFETTQKSLGSTQAELQKARQMASDLAKQQQESSQQLTSQLGQLAQEQEATKGNLGNLSTDVTGVKGEVKSTQTQLEATRAELKRVVGDLGVQSDLIAHTRTDLEALRARGDRDYTEFDIRKADKRKKVGTLQIQLAKADAKHQKYTIELVSDDKTVEKKDKTAFEPVQFYQQGFRVPTEIVVQQVSKDRITGYVSAPKIRDAQTTAANTTK